MNRPDILLIMSDQHRGACLTKSRQANGERTRVQTPHLRRLAESGACFTRFYSESPVCVPARGILQMGMLPHRLGMYANGDPLPANHPTLASYLAGDGYFCQVIIRDGAPTREVLIGQVGRGPQAHLMALGEEWKDMYDAGENRELLFRYRGESPELVDHLATGTGSGSARDVAARLRGVLQARYRSDGVMELLDDSSPNGFRLYVPRPVSLRPAAPSGVRRQNEQYAR